MNVYENIQFNRILALLESFLGPSSSGFDDNLQAQFDCPACAAEKGLTHGDGKHNLEVNVRLGVFKCWACSQTNDMHGSVYRLIRMYGGGKTLEEYKKEIASIRQSRLYDLNFHSGDFLMEEDIGLTEDTGVRLPASFRPLIYDDPAIPEKAKRYLLDRGVTQLIATRHGIGVTSGSDPDKMARNRIVIPSIDRFGSLNYWTARDFTGRSKLKYYNDKAERVNLVFNEGLVNFDADVSLVEGPFDHLAVPNSIPLLSKVLKRDYAVYAALYLRCRANVNVILDADARDDAVAVYKLLNTGRLLGRVRLVPIEDKSEVKYDPAKILEQFGPKGIRALLKRARPLTWQEEVVLPEVLRRNIAQKKNRPDVDR